MLHVGRLVPSQCTKGVFLCVNVGNSLWGLCVRSAAISAKRNFKLSKCSDDLRGRGSTTRNHRLMTVIGPIASTDGHRAWQGEIENNLERHGLDESDYTIAMPPFNEKVTGSERKRKKEKLVLDTVKQDQSRVVVCEDWCAYLLLSADSHKTYVGVTYDIKRRLRQHNGELVGGAKAARAGRPWRLVCTVHGFTTRSEAYRFEWRWKEAARNIKTVTQKDSEAFISPLVIRRRKALDAAQSAVEEWKDLRIEWHTH